jgi:hypothetical protein
MTYISHEIPRCLIDEHQDFISDYQFVLLHKILEDKDYAELVCAFAGCGEFTYLDNSCFELGESLDNDILYEWFTRLEPNYVVLPDVLGDKKRTLERSLEFINDYPDTIIHGMPVIQGSTPDEMIECYNDFMKFEVGHEGGILGFPIIGIPFVYSWIDKDPTLQANERIKLLEKMDKECINKSLKHHLLGTWQAREFAHYRKYDWIHSIDTSNPVMSALDGTPYAGIHGLTQKPKSTFDSVYDMKEEDINLDLLYYNVDTFREIVTGIGFNAERRSAKFRERKYPKNLNYYKYEI